MRAIDFALSRILPEDMRQDSYDMSKKGIAELMSRVAREYPDQYRVISKQVGDIGRKNAFVSGYTVRPEDVDPVIDTSTYFTAMDDEIRELRANNDDDEKYDEARKKVMQKYSDLIEKDTMSAALKSSNSIARSVISGARGNAAHVKAILSTPGIYADAKGNVIPLFVRNSFASGVRPAETLAGTYGGRASVVSTKVATAKGGDYCLAAGTKVRMADGTTQSIENIKVGDLVLGADKEGNTLPVKVVNVFDQGIKTVKDFHFSSYLLKEEFTETCTEEHKFLVDYLNLNALDVVPIGHSLGNRFSFIRPADFSESVICHYPTSEREAHCWDIEVDHPDHLFVLASGLICSNSKILNQSTSHYNVTQSDCGASNGLDFDPSDTSLRGRVLARDVAGLKAGEVIDKHALAVLRKQKDLVIARSPMTCRSEHGLCAKCAGLNPDGKFPSVGESLGFTAGQSVGEPIVQSGLNAKHNCLLEGTLVRMADYSVRNIESIKCGEYVLGADTNGDTFPVLVKHLWDQGTQMVQRYTYRQTPSLQTFTIECTAEHEILQVTKYSNCRESKWNHVPRKLNAGRVAGRPSIVLCRDHTPHQGLAAEPLAAVVGYVLGDGIRFKENQGHLRVSCACLRTAVDIDELLQGHGMHLKKAKRSHDWTITTSTRASCARSKDGRFEKDNRRSELRNKLTLLGLESKYAQEKTIPEVIWGWDQDSVAKLIAGFVSADGSVFRNKCKAPGISMSSTAKDMLVSIKSLLTIRFGIHSSALTKIKKADGIERKYDLWAFSITSRDQVARFASKIATHILGGKGDKLLRYIQEAPYSNKSEITHCKAKRVSIEDVGLRNCWDISVDHPDELFVLANGIIVKNSGAAKGKKEFSGFDVVSQFAQIPDDFKDKATVSELAGTVTKIREAPQGGHYISVDNEEHFVLPGFDLLVKPGDSVEAGDQLADGLVNPADIVRLRGLGEGRRFYADRLEQILQDSGQPPDRRNIELIARATVDHVRVEDADEDSDFLPDDLVRESEYMKSYKQPADTKTLPTYKAAGNYLQQPVLHYTVGTQLTPKMIKRMEQAGASEVLVSPTAPSFKPDMQRLRTASHSDRDWMSSLSTSYLGKQMTQSAERGDETDIKSNYHYAPRLAAGEDFGKNIEQTGKF